MIQLNLLPDIKKEFINAQKTKGRVISVAILVTLGALGVSVVLFVYVTFIQQLQLSLVNDDIARKTAEIKKVQDIDKYLTIQNQLKSLPVLHDEKGLYSRLFLFLPILNPSAPNNITLSTLQVTDSDKSIAFTGTTKSFESFNIFIDTLQNAELNYSESDDSGAEVKKVKMFEAVQVDNATLGRVDGDTQVSFTVKAKYSEYVFSAKTYKATLIVPNIQTTQSVTDSPKPLQLFEGTPSSGEGQ